MSYPYSHPASTQWAVEEYTYAGEARINDLITDFRRAMDSLVVANQQYCASLTEDITSPLSPVAFARNFATIRVDCARRIGKTQWIKYHSNRCQSMGLSTLVVVPNMRNHLHEYKHGLDGDIVSALGIEEGEVKDRFFDMIYMDNVDHIFRIVSQDILYGRLAVGMLQTFVLLGDG